MHKLPKTMSGVLLTGHGGLDKLEYRTDLPVPEIGDDGVLVKMEAAGVNNTDINTRIGWYSKTVETSTNASGNDDADMSRVVADAAWNGEALVFPRIQGIDCYGEIVALGKNVPAERLGNKILIRSIMLSPVNYRPYECYCLGSECDGGFAEYVSVPAAESFTVDSDLSPIELGAIPCAFSTAEGMLERAGVAAGDRVLVTGASGGVGSAAVQLAKLRGAHVSAVGSRSKLEAMKVLGADALIARQDDLLDVCGRDAFSVIIDLVGGENFQHYADLLSRGGRYTVSGAIAGPIVNFDLRSFYLKDLSFYGSTAQSDKVFHNLIGYIKERRIKPIIAASYKLSQIHAAQEKFLAKDFIGKIVLTP